jgi:hypothetical protein
MLWVILVVAFPAVGYACFLWGWAVAGRNELRDRNENLDRIDRLADLVRDLRRSAWPNAIPRDNHIGRQYGCETDRLIRSAIYPDQVGVDE